MYVYVDIKNFISYIFKSYSALTPDLEYRTPPTCVGAILQT